MELPLLVVSASGATKRELYTLHPQSKVFISSLIIADSSEDHFRTIVRKDTAEALRIADYYLPILIALKQYHSLDAVARASKCSLHDVYTFVEMLVINQFVSRIDTLSLYSITPHIRPWLPTLDLQFLHKICNTYVYLISSFICVLAIGFAIFYTGQVPSFSSFYWHPNLFISFISITIFELFIVAAHEISHFITTLAIGGKSRINLVRNRSIFLVYETESYYIETKPKIDRIAVYISGIVVDLLQIFIAYMVLVFITYSQIESRLLTQGILSYILIAVIGILWQFNIYLKTDIYNVVEELLGQSNLYENTRWYILHRLQTTKGIIHSVYKLICIVINPNVVQHDADNLSELTNSDRRVVHRYALFVGISSVVSLIMFFVFVVYRDLLFVQSSLEILFIQLSFFSFITFLQYLLIIGIVTFNYVLLGISWYRNYSESQMKKHLLTELR